MIYFLAVGTPVDEYAVPPRDYYRLLRTVEGHEDMPPYVVSWSGTLFTYFFSHCWIRYRDLAADDPAEFGVDGPRVDWFENSRRAALTHRQRCIEMSDQYPTLGENRWGLAPCSSRDRYCVQHVQPNMSDNDDFCGGVVPPYGAGSMIVVTPAESMAALREYYELRDSDGQPLVWRDPERGGYGFVDSFQLDPDYAHEEYLGIDVGPLLLAIENARTGLIWKLFMQHEVSQAAVARLRLRPRDTDSGTGD